MDNKQKWTVILFVALAVFVAGCKSDDGQIAAYRSQLLALSDTIAANAEMAGEVLDAYADAWDNPAIRNQDFMVALTGVRRTLDGTVNAVVNGRKEVADMLAELGDPPKSLAEEHAAVQNMFESYSAMVQLCEQPSGTLDAFRAKVEEFRARINEAHGQMTQS